jgi:hypothetical protein
MYLVDNLRRLAWIGRGYRNWYPAAYSFAVDQCNQHDWNVKRYVEVMAVLSPRCKVARNITRTKLYMSTGFLPHDVPCSVRSALDYYEETGIIRGPKTSSFARAILGDNNAIVLDVWICKALDCPHKLITRLDCRQVAERTIRSVAMLCGMSPRDTQACIWSGIVQQSGLKVPTIGGVH